MKIMGPDGEIYTPKERGFWRNYTCTYTYDHSLRSVGLRAWLWRWVRFRGSVDREWRYKLRRALRRHDFSKPLDPLRIPGEDKC